ncbi:MAG: outer membrane lipoprotein-sorting protein [Chlorobi bacterium]|nr:outer membrane lipoprotein-sorting protein [Chlorobiota bacterium]
MKKPIFFTIIFFLIAGYNSKIVAQELTAKEIVKKANDKMRGITSYTEMDMKVIRPKWERSLSFKMWSKNPDYSLLYVTYPAKEKGQVFLKREKEMWNWIPSIQRMIKIPPSMMMQSWMGSDVTNDDLVKESSIVADYDHSIIGEETIEGYLCYKILLIPHEDSPVVWGKIITWVAKNEFITLKNEYYDEDDFLINSENLSNIKNVGDRTIPTYFEIVPAEKEGQKTTMEFKKIKFNIDIDDSFFSIQNMKKIR